MSWWGVLPLKSFNLSRTTNGVFSMPDKSGFEVAVGPARAVMRFLGIWSDPVLPETTFAIFRFLLAAVAMFIFGNVPQTTMLFKVWGDLDAMIEILTTANIAIFIAFLKFMIAWYNRQVLKELVIYMTEDWQHDYKERDRQTMWKNARYSQKLSIVCISLAVGTIISQFIMVSIFDVNNKDDGLRPLYMISYFPYDTQKTPNYEVTWLLQCYSNVCGGTSFSSVDSFFIVLVLHLCGQLAILRRALIELADDAEEASHKENFARNLAYIVDRHQHLNRYAKTLEESFNVMFLTQLIIQSLALCLQGYQVVMIITESKGDLTLFQLLHMIYFTCTFSFSLFVYCYIAEELRYESTQINEAAYETSWYNLPPNETKLFLLFMHRGGKPLEITAGKFVAFSLELYCSILKSTGGYLSMLLAVKDRLVPEDT